MPYTLTDWEKRIDSRSDLTTHLVHLTKGTKIDGKELDSIEVLMKILSEKCLLGSTTKSGYICGDIKAVCTKNLLKNVERE